MTANPRYAKNYSPSGFGNFVKKYARRIGEESIILAYKLYFTLMDGKASTRTKALIAAALGYGICPIDAIPDFVPLLGLSDDAAILTATALSVASDITPETSAKAERKAAELFGTEAKS